MMNKRLPLRIAVLGFGGRAESTVQIAKEHPDRFAVTAIADPDSRRRERAHTLCPDAVLFDNANDFYASGTEVDGIWVISQEKTHADLAIPAMERNIPLICEKPLATTVEAAVRICEAWATHPVPFVVPHSLRYLPWYIKVKELIDSGVIGQIMHIHAVEQIPDFHTVGYYRRGPGMYRSNTTFLLAKSSHDIDIINWMMSGAKAVSIASFGGADYFKPRPEVPKRCGEDCPEVATCPFAGEHSLTGEPQTPVAVDNDTLSVSDQTLCAWNSGAEQVDHQTLILRYDNGATADFTLNCFGDDARPLQVTGSLGTIYAKPDEVRLVTYHPEKEEIFHTPAGSGTHGGGDAALLLDWADAVENNTTPKGANVYESAEAVRVCIAADIAMLEHRIVEIDTLPKT